MFGIFLTNNLLISDINMSGDCTVWRLDTAMQCESVDIKPCHVDLKQCSYMSGEEQSRSHVDIKQCRVDINQCNYMSGEEQSRSHEDIKPCGVDINQSSDSITSSVNITLPLSALKNVPGLTSIFAPILAANVPLPRVAVGSVGEVKQEIKALPVAVNVPSVPGAPVPIVGVSEPGHSDMGRNNTGEETQSESEPAPESVPEAVPEENQSDSEFVPEIKEPVPEIKQPVPDIKDETRRKRRKVGEQIEANESEDEFENNDSRIAKAKAKAKALKKTWERCSMGDKG